MLIHTLDGVELKRTYTIPGNAIQGVLRLTNEEYLGWK